MAGPVTASGMAFYDGPPIISTNAATNVTSSSARLTGPGPPL